MQALKPPTLLAHKEKLISYNVCNDKFTNKVGTIEHAAFGKYSFNARWPIMQKTFDYLRETKGVGIFALQELSTGTQGSIETEGTSLSLISQKVDHKNIVYPQREKCY